MTAGTVHSWDLATAVDGPGTRFVVFTAGCPLRCLYCHDPETRFARYGQRVSVDDLVTEIAKYRRFIDVAGGGVTISGGEPLLQPEFTAELLHAVKGMGLHTALDTSGFPGDRATDELLADTDLVLLDIKSWDPTTYRHVTGGEIAPTLRFARRLADLDKPMWIRFVLVPGLTDATDNVEGIASFVSTMDSVDRVDVLPFHKMGTPKYEAIGLPFALADTPIPDSELVEHVRGQFRAQGLRT
ncbi:pyruvate formate lyase activating enzyme [Saccharothrix ecbatanensis]|uniref:Pyruvate formate-lyase-activating enzyme n=1 Tax=Saccharothrix ecbatanensis TaxID=1105145 RepID=A0A7W9HFU4_9PSEU|nr:pyruvate formate-lyase-activating protein [Saccharothrix ecbatanensis]MBB5801171.1 pyruvate formate lyase activating enzyme [Saccharothrix ecbatanensis]